MIQKKLMQRYKHLGERINFRKRSIMNVVGGTWKKYIFSKKNKKKKKCSNTIDF